MTRYKYGVKKITRESTTCNSNVRKLNWNSSTDFEEELDMLNDEFETLDQSLSELEYASQNMVDQIELIRSSVSGLRSFT